MEASESVLLEDRFERYNSAEPEVEAALVALELELVV